MSQNSLVTPNPVFYLGAPQIFLGFLGLARSQASGALIALAVGSEQDQAAQVQRNRLLRQALKQAPPPRRRRRRRL